MHGADGIDEISTTGHTKVSECRDGAVHTFYIHPSEFGIRKATLAELLGGDAAENAAIVRRVLEGQAGAPRDAVVLNAGAALFVADRVAVGARGHWRGGIGDRLRRRAGDARDHGAGVEGRGCGMSAPDLLRDDRRGDAADHRDAACAGAGRRRWNGVRWRASSRGDRFEAALGMAGRVNVIAECKRRSPSRGVLAAHYDPVVDRHDSTKPAVPRRSRCSPSRRSSTAHWSISPRSVTAVDLPLLRKDFVVDDYQLLEARAAGADAVLLIVAALEQSELVRLQSRAWELGLAALVEVHDDEELARAIESGARLIGVNNRNLRTLTVDVSASDRLAAKMPGRRRRRERERSAVERRPRTAGGGRLSGVSDWRAVHDRSRPGPRHCRV